MLKFTSLSSTYSDLVLETSPVRSQKSENLIEMTVRYCLDVWILKEEVQPRSLNTVYSPNGFTTNDDKPWALKSH